MTDTAPTMTSLVQVHPEAPQTVFVTGGSGFLGRRLIPALISAGYRVRAMARSDESAATVEQLGAAAARCDLSDSSAVLTGQMRGCEMVVHAAGRFREGGGHAAYERDNIAGTQKMLSAAESAGVRRFVYVGAAGCLVGGKPVQDADESWPLQELPYSPYFRSKTIADRAVRAASNPGFATCVVRPGVIWGGRDDVFTKSIAEATRAGKMMFIDGGAHSIVTSHVDNTIRESSSHCRRALAVRHISCSTTAQFEPATSSGACCERRASRLRTEAFRTLSHGRWPRWPRRPGRCSTVRAHPRLTESWSS